MYTYTDGNQNVTAILFEDNHRAAHYAFNIINNVDIDALVAPPRAIDYIMNNSRITLPNGSVVNYGEYIVKYATGECHRYGASDFKNKYVKVDAAADKNHIPDGDCRVTLEQITSLIDGASKEYTYIANRLTTVVVTLESGFMLTGESFCADPNTYDESKGEAIVLSKVRDKLWELENYRVLYDLARVK